MAASIPHRGLPRNMLGSCAQIMGPGNCLGMVTSSTSGETTNWVSARGLSRMCPFKNDSRIGATANQAIPTLIKRVSWHGDCCFKPVDHQ